MAVFRNMARIVGAGPLIVIDTDVEGSQRSNPSNSVLHVVERGHGHARRPDLAVNVGAFVRVAAVERDRVEGRRQPGCGLVIREQVKPAVGAEGVPFAGEHAGGLLLFPLERENASRKREPSREVLRAQPSEQLAAVGEVG